MSGRYKYIHTQSYKPCPLPLYHKSYTEYSETEPGPRTGKLVFLAMMLWQDPYYYRVLFITY
jgi:hypothetical protein